MTWLRRPGSDSPRPVRSSAGWEMTRPYSVAISFDPAGMVRQGNTFTTPGYDRADRTLDLEVTAAVGGVRVEWLDGEARE